MTDRGLKTVPGRVARALAGGVVGLSLTGLALAGVAGSVGCSSTETSEPVAAAPEVAPGTYLPDFDMSWELVRDTHFDEEFNGVDWDAVREELRPKAELATSRSESRAIISDMLGRLGQSHFGLIPEDNDEFTSEGVDEGADATSSSTGTMEAPNMDGQGRATVGLDFRIVDGQAMVTSVRSGGPADLAGVRPGWILMKIRDRDVQANVDSMIGAVGEKEAGMYAWQALSARMMGPEGSSVPLTFLDGSDSERVVEVERGKAPGEYVKFGNLPAMSTNLDARWLTAEETGDPETKVALIAFNIWMVPIAPQFERAMVEYQDADGMIIDLRGNLGGIGGLSSSVARFLLTEPGSLGTMTMRGAELSFNVEPVVVTSRGERLSPFAGPIAIVTDQTSASTSEVFAGGMHALGRARVFGDRSAGAALPALMDKLPSGDVLLHAMADFVTSDGTRMEGDGVPVDVPVPVLREDLLNGVDAPLVEAARWIVNETTDAPTSDAASMVTTTEE